MLLQSGPRTRTSVGFVKWFGGINKKTGKENEFGFIENIDGDDLFVHASQLGGAMPEEGNFAVFTVDGKDADKKKAVDVSICSNTETYKTEPLIEFLYDIDGFQKMIASREYRSVLSRLVNRSDNSWALDFLSDMLPISSSARFVVGKMIEDWDQQVQLLDRLSIPSITEADNFCDFVPSRYFDERHDKWIDWLKSISQSERDLFFEHKIEDLSLSFVLACAFEGIIDQTVQLGTHQERMADFATETFQNAFIAKRSGNVSVKLHEYVRTLYGQKFNGFDDFSRCSAISPHFELPKIKQKIINRDRSFVSDIARSEALRGHPEAFVLSKLLPLIWDGNNDLSVEAVFFHELWQAMLSDQLDIRHPGFMKLFPSCGTFGTDLSCEATYWSKGEHCYCRNKKCRDPQVLPDLQKSYLDYNVYDWLSYFGRNYATTQQPSRRDFPIKLAGYFNRVKELRRVLNCRCCGTLMKPDFKYSRVEVKIYDEETGLYHSEPFSAAYRSTVFYCDSAGCTERGDKHYLNHCLGSKCSLIVDSRDLQKCSNGFYKCSCGSCCKEHQFEAEQRKRQLEQMIQDRGSRRFGR